MGDVEPREDVESKAKPKSKLPIIMIGFVVLLGVIGAISMTMLGGKGGDPKAAPMKAKSEPVGYNYDFPAPFTVMMASTSADDQFMLTVSITLEIEPNSGVLEKDALAEIGIETEKKTTRMARIYDTINTILSSKTRPEVNSAAGRENIKIQIKNSINSFLNKSKIVEVYLKSLIIS